MTETYQERLDRELQEHFGAEARRLERAVETFERARQQTYRPDGVTRLYGPEELAEREQRALAAYDETAAEITAAVDQAVAEAEQELAKLEGTGPIDRLTEAELARANARRAFVQEDAAGLPPEQLVPRVRAALAAGDTVDLVLWSRYLPARVQAMPATPARTDLVRLLADIGERLADPTIKERRGKAERRREVGKVLLGRVSMRRADLNGSAARAGRMMRL
jgi:pyruvate/2-oxoglutarate dehydrogenase complex dihydrolipoamide acyltransferase (E2) component